MPHRNHIKPAVKIHISSKPIFTITLLVMALTILSIWLLGLGQHRTLFENSLLSTSILSLAFFLFLSISLYKGVKLKDDLGKLTDKIKPSKVTDLENVPSGGDFPTIGDGIEGIILGMVFWFFSMILFAIFLWLFGAVLWTGVIVFIAMLYWIFFRALRLVFKNSNKCKGNLTVSVVYGLAYTTLYNFWIYGIILIAHYLIN